KRFANDYQKNKHNLSQAVIQMLYQQLTQIYAKGVIEKSLYTRIASDTLHNIRIINGKEASSERIVEFFTPTSAYNYILESPQMVGYRTQLENSDIEDYIRPNLLYDYVKNSAEEEDIEASVIPTKGIVKKHEKIVDRGENITPEIYLKLRSFEEQQAKIELNRNDIVSTMGGQLLYTIVMVFLLLSYIYLFRRDYFEKPRLMLLQFLLITAFSVMVSMMMRHTLYSVYYLPYAALPMFIRVFMDSRTAFISHVIMVLICACVVKYQYEFIIIQLVSGAVAIDSMRHLNKRSDVFKAAVNVVIATCVIYATLQLMQDKLTTEFDSEYYKFFVVSGILLLFAYPLMYLVERVFKFTSDVTLIELSNPSNPLLRKLSVEAPGTYQHCTMVGNLAAEIAEKIGAEATLVRTGALYHDIGKTINPAYYTENQNGITSPLDAKDRKEAAQIIISHTKQGIQLAKENNLPKEIIDFIRTHHGKGISKYFYLKYKAEHPNEDIDLTDFSYEGPNPQTKEQAILMMADAVEAASRSLPEYSETAITELVNNIINDQIKNKYYDECPINFRDISNAKQVLIERLMSIYHTRIAYPKG
ncbi:MAG: HDIG domain-containing protein, partial [Prevotella sp.]|nr:HDIG domain-containing protein [Prevotella sp.]